MNRIRVGGIVVLAILFPSGLEAQDKPTKFAPGQVWRSLGVDGEKSVHFVVLETNTMKDIGPVVCVRLSGLPSSLPGETRRVVDRTRTVAYPVAILTRHADVLVATLPRRLFPEFDFKRWVTAGDAKEVVVQTLAPSILVRDVRRWAAKFNALEAKLPAYLPKDPPATVEEKQRKGPVIRVLIITIERGKRQGNRMIGHRVAYRVGTEKCADLDALRNALRTWGKIQTGTPRVIVEPGQHTVYGDVAPVVEAIIEAGFKDVKFGGGLSGKPVASSERKDKRVVTMTSTANIAAGQIWSYRVPEGEKPKTLTVQIIIKVPGHGEIAFVRMNGLSEENKTTSRERFQTEWVPFWTKTLVRHLERKRGTGTTKVSLDDVRLLKWQTDFAKGIVGYATVSPWHMVRAYRAFLKVEKLPDLEDLILPRARTIKKKD